MKRIRRNTSILLILSLILSNAIPAYAEEMYIDSEELQAIQDDENESDLDQSFSDETYTEEDLIEEDATLSEDEEEYQTEDDEEEEILILEDSDEEDEIEVIPDTDIDESETVLPDEDADENPDLPSEDTPSVKPEEDPSIPALSDWLKVGESYSLDLLYDDRYDFNTFLENCAILKIDNETITSYRVNKGQVMSGMDTAVLTPSSLNKATATAIGKASVILVDQSDYETALSQLEIYDSVDPSDPSYDSTIFDSFTSIDAVEVSVEVAPATLTLMLLLGQSNMEGGSSETTGYEPENSVMCEAGQVYSTYVPTSDSRAVNITGLSDVGSNTGTGSMARWTAGSLGNDNEYSITGAKLPYALNSLTEEGYGKAGPDSGIAYNWHKLTGDKVWAMNAAWCGSSIASWIPGSKYYERALSLYDQVSKTYEAEISAGHYTEGRRLMFWMQGCADKFKDASYYYTHFQSMYKGINNYCELDYTGILMVRASYSSHHADGKDLYLSGPRAALYMISASTSFPKVYLVSNENENWISDQGVKDYFSTAYPSGLSYPLRSYATLKRPSRLSDIHTDIHYSQAGHNENGLKAAENLYRIIYNKTTSGSKIVWKNQDYQSISTLSVYAPASAIVIPIDTKCPSRKGLSVSGSNLSYNVKTATLTVSEPGSRTATATIASNTSGIPVKGLLKSPVVSLATKSKGIVLSWNKIKKASGYRVYRKTGSGKYRRIATLTADITSYTDKSVIGNTRYVYFVVAFNGKTVSSYTEHAIRYLNTVKLTLSNELNGVRVTWKAIAGASKYTIVRKKTGGKYEKLRTVRSTTTSYLDKTAENGTKYAYAVYATNRVSKSWPKPYSITRSNTGIFPTSKGQYRYYVQGTFQSNFTGILEYQKKKYYIRKGIWLNNYDGVVEFDNNTYIISNGLVSKVIPKK